MKDYFERLGLTRSQQKYMMGEDVSQKQFIEKMVLHQMHMKQRENFTKEEMMLLEDASSQSDDDDEEEEEDETSPIDMPYEVQLMHALGAETPQEAINIMQANGIKPQDIQKYLGQKNLGKSQNYFNS